MDRLGVSIRGSLCVFSVYFWHSEGWTPRNEALLEAVVDQANTTRHPWLVACDANPYPEDFEKSLWFQRNLMHVEASTCTTKRPQGEWIEKKTYNHVIACNSFRGKSSHMEVGSSCRRRRRSSYVHPEMMEELSRYGSLCVKGCEFFRCTFGTQPEERGRAGGSLEASQGY